MSYFLVGCYLFAAVAANLVVNHFGPAALPFTAFCLIPFDHVSRDFLQDKWIKKGKMKMALLVFTGSALTLLVNISAWRIAVASSTAFVISNFVDYLVYAWLQQKHRLIKINVANIFSSITDSIIFPLVAFGSVSAGIAVSQSLSKIGGGFFWAAVFVGILKLYSWRGLEQGKKNSVSH